MIQVMCKNPPNINWWMVTTNICKKVMAELTLLFLFFTELKIHISKKLLTLLAIPSPYSDIQTFNNWVFNNTKLHGNQLFRVVNNVRLGAPCFAAVGHTGVAPAFGVHLVVLHCLTRECFPDPLPVFHHFIGHSNDSSQYAKEITKQQHLIKYCTCTKTWYLNLFFLFLRY